MARFTPHTDEDIKEMLAVVGVRRVEDLFRDIPDDNRVKSFNLPAGITEYEAMAKLQTLSEKNDIKSVNFMGGGYYDHFIPAAVDALAGRAEFFTAYTPYQAEASQGTLQAIFEYQSMIARLTGLDYSNASLYDGGTALYEAIAMAVRTTNRSKIVLDQGVNPLFRKIVTAYNAGQGIEIITAGLRDVSSDRELIDSLIDDKTAALVMQSPNYFGIIEDSSELFRSAGEKGLTRILAFNPMSLGVMKSPAEMGADIAVADGQPLGLPLSFGGPYLGIMAANKKYVRKMPGRIVGQTVDWEGQRAFVLTLQAREQHIKREKATSNICSNQALCALRAVVYLSLLGKDGFRRLGLINLGRVERMKKLLSGLKGFEVKPGPNFNEFTITLPVEAKPFASRMAAKGFLAGIPASVFFPEKKNELIVAVTEKRTDREMEAYAEAARGCLS